MYKLFYFLKRGLGSLKSSLLITFISTLTISVALILIGLFLIVSVNINTVIENFSNNFNITVYLKEDVPAKRVDVLLETFKNMKQVKAVSFQSAHDIKNEIVEIFGLDIVKDIPEEALPLQPAVNLTLEVRQLNHENINEALRFIKKIKEVESVDSIVHGISGYRLILLLSESFRYIVFVITIVVIIASLFFIFSNIRLSIFARRDEIEVMKLVGATKWFIRIPFLIEGVTQGVIGGLIGFVILWFLNFHINSYLASEYFISFEVQLLPTGVISLFFLGGIILGALGSFLSLFRYLKI